MKTACSF